MRTISIPLYILNDNDLTDLIDRAQEMMTELAGEQHMPELPVLISQLRHELDQRINTLVSLEEMENDDA